MVERDQLTWILVSDWLRVSPSRGKVTLVQVTTLSLSVSVSGAASPASPDSRPATNLQTLSGVSAVVQLLTRPGLGSKNSDLKDTTKTKEKLSSSIYRYTHALLRCRHCDLIMIDMPLSFYVFITKSSQPERYLIRKCFISCSFTELEHLL